MLKNVPLVIILALFALSCATSPVPEVSLAPQTSPSEVATDPLDYKQCTPSAKIDPEQDLVEYWRSLAPELNYLIELWEQNEISLLNKRSRDPSCKLMEQVISTYYLYALTHSRQVLDHLISIYPEDINATKWLDLDFQLHRDICKDKDQACIPSPDHVIFETALAGQTRSVALIAIHYTGVFDGAAGRVKAARLRILLNDQPAMFIDAVVQNGLQPRLLDYLKWQIEQNTNGVPEDVKNEWLKKEITRFSSMKIPTQSGMDLKHDIIQLHRSFQ